MGNDKHLRARALAHVCGACGSYGELLWTIQVTYPKWCHKQLCRWRTGLNLVPLSTRVRLLIFSDFPEIFQGNNDQSSHSHCWWRSQGIFLFPCLTHALQHTLHFTIFNVITQYPNGCQLLSNNVSLNQYPPFMEHSFRSPSTLAQVPYHYESRLLLTKR